MAKKIAVSTNHLILDIPVGPTMKIKHFNDAEKVSAKFKKLGRKFGIEMVFDVNQTLEPAGRGVGPALEARDVLYVLEQKKDRPLALETKALRLAGKLLDICFKDAKIKKSGEQEAYRILHDGIALSKFREIVKAQGGNDEVTSEKLKIKSDSSVIKSPHSGKIKSINNFNLNTIAKILGAPENKWAGIYLFKKTDESVDKNEPLLTLYSRNDYHLEEAKVTYKNFPIYEIET
jgi:thymidine phosphorylase